MSRASLSMRRASARSGAGLKTELPGVDLLKASASPAIMFKLALPPEVIVQAPPAPGFPPLPVNPPIDPDVVRRQAEAAAQYEALLAVVPLEERRLTGETSIDPEIPRVIAVVNDHLGNFPGGKPGVVSHWRSYGAQSGIVINKLRSYHLGLYSTVEDIRRALVSVLRASAMPGFSRHHWGTDVDVVSVDEGFWNNRPELTRLVHDQISPIGFYTPYREGYFPSPNEPHFEDEPWHLSYYPIASGLRDAWLSRVNVPALLDRLALTLGGALDVPTDRFRSALESLNLRGYHENVASPPIGSTTGRSIVTSRGGRHVVRIVRGGGWWPSYGYAYRPETDLLEQIRAAYIDLGQAMVAWHSAAISGAPPAEIARLKAEAEGARHRLEALIFRA